MVSSAMSMRKSTNHKIWSPTFPQHSGVILTADQRSAYPVSEILHIKNKIVYLLKHISNPFSILYDQVKYV